MEFDENGSGRVIITLQHLKICIKKSRNRYTRTVPILRNVVMIIKHQAVLKYFTNDLTKICY